jgi:hypothetical protein
MRDNHWLLFRLDEIWRNHFKDIPQVNPVSITFGRNALYRFGSIRLNFSTGKTQILINGRFRDEQFPQEVVDHTIAHELVHYAQGFSSPNPRLHRYPHRGGVIDKELKDRGLDHLVDFYKHWVKEYIKSLPE